MGDRFHGADRFRESASADDIKWVGRANHRYGQRCPGVAAILRRDQILVLYGDVPCCVPDVCKGLRQAGRQASAADSHHGVGSKPVWDVCYAAYRAVQAMRASKGRSESHLLIT